MNKHRGAVWWVNLDPTIGAEIKKQRPCAIVSHSSINAVRRTVIIYSFIFKFQVCCQAPCLLPVGGVAWRLLGA